jgi:TetR/AcrR family transcriptional regulator, mexJK operon transcriptional repressor
MPAPTEDAPFDRSDAKTQQILNAAKTIFMERGYADTSMDQVSHAAGVSKTTLYTRFPSKEALFSGVVRREVEQVGLHFQPDELLELPVEEALLRIARRILDILCSPEKRRAEQILVAESGRFPDLTRIFMESGPNSAHARLIEYFEKATARGLFACEDPASTAMLFDAMLDGNRCVFKSFGHNYNYVPTPDERDAYARKAIGLLLNGIAPGRP